MWRRFSLFLVQRVALGISLLVIGWWFVDQWPSIRELQIQFSMAPALFSFILLIGIFFLDAMGWYLILRALKERPAPARMFYIWMASSVTRYLPGGIWAYASRAAMAKEAGIGTANCAASLYLETLLLMVSALLIGLPALLDTTGLHFGLRESLLLVGAALIMMHPRVLILSRLLPGAIGRAFRQVEFPNGLQLTGLLCYYLLFWCAFGAVFAIATSAIIPGAETHLVLLGSSMALGFFVGFVLIFFPGGIGVRESTMYLALLTALPTPAALLISILSRVWVMCGEVISLSVAWIVWRKLRVPPRKD